MTPCTKKKQKEALVVFMRCLEKRISKHPIKTLNKQNRNDAILKKGTSVCWNCRCIVAKHHCCEFDCFKFLHENRRQSSMGCFVFCSDELLALGSLLSNDQRQFFCNSQLHNDSFVHIVDCHQTLVWKHLKKRQK